MKRYQNVAKDEGQCDLGLGVDLPTHQGIVRPGPLSEARESWGQDGSQGVGRVLWSKEVITRGFFSRASGLRI